MLYREGVILRGGYMARGHTCGRTLTGVKGSCLAANNNVRNKGKNCNTSCRKGFMVSGPSVFMAVKEFDRVPVIVVIMMIMIMMIR